MLWGKKEIEHGKEDQDIGEQVVFLFSPQYFIMTNFQHSEKLKEWYSEHHMPPT